MARFSDLPNELVGEVAGYTFPENIDNFAFLSKGILEVSWPLLKEYWVLKKKYKDFENIGNADFDGRRLESGHLPDPVTTNHTLSPDFSGLLFDVLENLSVAHFIREIRLEGWWESWESRVPNPSSNRREHTPYGKKHLALFSKALATYVLPEKLDAWIKELKQGHEDPVVSLLLILLPRINSLKFEQCDDPTNRLMEVLKRIKTDCKADVTVLSGLKKINLLYNNYADDLTAHSVDTLAFLATIPSLKCLYSQYIMSSEDGHDFGCLAPDSSNITDLAFKNCKLTLKELGGLLQGLRALQKFTYIDDGYDPDEVAAPWDPAGICKLLLEHAKQSLEALDLRCKEEPDVPIDSLGDFGSLKELTLTFSLFRGGARIPSPSQSLMSQLPRCIQKISLHDIEKEDVSLLEDMRHEAVQFRADRWPALERFCLCASLASGCVCEGFSQATGIV